MESKNKLIELIEKHFEEPYQSYLKKNLRSSIRLKTNGLTNNKIGQTKLGGRPDLPINSSWPKSSFNNQYYSFLGQVNLKEISVFDDKHILPNKGIFYFFFNLDSGDDGVLIFSNQIELERKEFPPEFSVKKKSFLRRLFTGRKENLKLKESAVEFTKEFFLPSWDSLLMEKIHLELQADIKPIDSFSEGLSEELEKNGDTEDTPNHHLLGFYNGIQHEYLEFECIDDIDVDKEMLLVNIEKAFKWKLLMQFDTDEHLDLCWADGGRIYFFIHEDDLKKHNFNNIRVTADCY